MISIDTKIDMIKREILTREAAKNIAELEAELGSISKMTDEELATTLTNLEKEKGL